MAMPYSLKCPKCKRKGTHAPTCSYLLGLRIKLSGPRAPARPGAREHEHTTTRTRSPLSTNDPPDDTQPD